MIDFSKLSGPAGGSSTPVGPTTPVPTPLPDFGTSPSAPAEPQPQGFNPNPTQAQIDAMSPWDRAGRGLDVLGQALFGQNNGSALGGVPVVGEAGRALGVAGDVLHGAGSVALKPFEIAGAAASRVPLGWLPGGADEAFNKIGEWAKTNDPEMWQKWQTVNAAANGDYLGGGNLRADFNMEAADKLDQMTYGGTLGANPLIAMGRQGIGSVGGAFSHAVQGFLGLAANTAQGALGNAGIFDPSGHGGQPQTIQQVLASKQAVGSVSDDEEYALQQFQSGKFNEQQANEYLANNAGAGRSRVAEAMSRIARGGEASDVEKTAAAKVQSGEWSEQHANDYIVSHGQSVTRNPIGQLVVGTLTDPLLYATAGAGAVSKAGVVGKAVAEAGVGPATQYERLASVVADVQNSSMGPAFRIARGLIDPLGVYTPKDSASRGLIDLYNGVAIKAFQSAGGAKAYDALRALGREFGKTTEVDSAIATYSVSQAKLLTAIEARFSQLREGIGEKFVHTNPDDVIEPLMKAAPKDVVHRLTDHMLRVAKNEFPEGYDNLASRASILFGDDKATWLPRIEKMTPDLRSNLHAITYETASKDFAESLAKVERPHASGNAHLFGPSDTAYEGKLPLDRTVLLNESNLDDVSAEALFGELSGKDTLISQRVAAWNAAAKRYPAVADYGYATGSSKQLGELIGDLKRDIDTGHFHVRVKPDELADPALQPLRDFIDRNTVDGKPLWNLGFRPSEDVAWGLRRKASNGKWIVGYDPTISHVMDAVPASTPFRDTVRNVAGQIIGGSKAEALMKPVDSLDAFIRTGADVVSGQRLVMNIERRFTRSMVEKVGLPKPIVKEIFARARDVAGLERTTFRGLRSGSDSNIWNAVHDAIPEDFRLPNGSALDVHTVMGHLLDASEGDLRIMGLSSVLTQRMRNIIRKGVGPIADPDNWMGQMTVTMYNKLRYSQPTFLIQRASDSAYFGALRGVMPMGGGALKSEALKATRRIEENMGRTGVARDFAMDAPEYATRSNFSEGIRNRAEQLAADSNRLAKIGDAPNTLIANNMTKQLHARFGQTVRETLDDLPNVIKSMPEDMQAEMLAEAQGPLSRSFADFRAIYSQATGRTLDDNEVGLKYIQEMLASARRITMEENGIKTSGLMHEMAWQTPASIGEIGTIHPDALAQELGLRDADHLRDAVNGTFKKGQFVEGKWDIPSLQEKLREEMHMHPDAVARVSSYFGSTWKDYWDRLAKPIEAGGLDISPHYAQEAQDLVAGWAKARGMDPWEYLSGVMNTNVGPGALDKNMGDLMSFLQAGGKSEPIEAWTKFFRSNLDVSAQKTLLEEFSKATGTATPGLGSESGRLMDELDALTESIDDGADTAMVAKQKGDLIRSHGISTGHRFAPWGASHADSQAMTAESGKVMGFSKYKSENLSDPFKKGVSGYLKGIAESPGSDVPLYSGRRVEGSAVPKVGDVIDRPLTATTPSRSMAQGFSDSRDYRNTAKGYVMEFAPGTKATAHASDEYLTAGRFRVKSIEDVPFDKYHGYPETHPDAPSVKVVHVEHVEFYDPKTKGFVSTTGEVKPAAFTRDARQNAVLPKQFKHEPGYFYRVKTPDQMAAGVEEGAGFTAKPSPTYAESDAHAVYRVHEDNLRAPSGKGAGGADMEAAHPITPDQMEVLGEDGAWHPLPPDPYDQMFDSKFPQMVADRIKSGVPHPNPEIEGYVQQFSKWVQDSLKSELGERTRHDLRELVDKVPTADATPFNRTHALVQQLLRDKIRLNQDDIFMLAEMATRRNVAMRSLSHPLFGMYPASYMWGKVLPQTVKFLAKNPYGATYTIADVQRSIAIQREYNPDFDSTMNAVDKSSGAFLAGYLTPSLPWEDMQAQASPFVRDLLKGKDVGNIFKDEIATVSPLRWFSLLARSGQEVIDNAPKIFGDGQQTSLSPQQEQGLTNITQQQPAPSGPAQSQPVNGPVKGAGLAPVLSDQLSQLQDLFR